MNVIMMSFMKKIIIIGVLSMVFLFSVITTHAQSTSFLNRCQTYGFYGLDDWFHVQLQDMTGKVSDSCKADDWSVTMASGETDVYGEVIKDTQIVKIKRKEGGGMNVRAMSGNEMTNDNYIMLAKANSLLPKTKQICNQMKDDKFGAIKVCIKENAVTIKWKKYKGRAKYNAYSLLMKENDDFTESDLAIGVDPIYVRKNKKYYTFSDIETGGIYFFKVGIGNYQNGTFTDYGNFSQTISAEIPDAEFDNDY